MTQPGYSIANQAHIEPLGEALREHFERAPVGMLLLGADRRILAANESVGRMTGIKTAILPGSSLRRFLTSDAPSDLETRIFEELAREGQWLGEVDFRSSLGETSPMMLSVTPVAPETAGDVRFVCTIVELGQLRWIEAESFRRAQEIAAFSAIAVATGSSADPLEMLGAAARQVVEGLGMDACWIHRYDENGSRLSLVGEASYLNPSLQLSPRMIPDAVNPGVLRALESKELVAESELLDRSIATIVHMPLLARSEVVGVISILGVAGEKLTTRDSDLLRAVSYQIGTAVQNTRLVESVREHESELQEKNEQLEQLVERLRAADLLKNEFLANTSHELRTPLNSIIGFLNIVIDGLCQNDAERDELLGHALQSSRHLLALINDVLDLARIEAGKLDLSIESIPLGATLADVERTLQVQARGKGLSLRFHPADDRVYVRADAARLRQIVMNIVGNAIKFTTEGGVEVTTTATEGSPFVEIEVRDTGIGIAVDKRSRLFKKFSQGDASMTRKFGGSGLGLVIVKELLELMGGSIRVESEGEQRGTAVLVSIVRSWDDPAPTGS